MNRIPVDTRATTWRELIHISIQLTNQAPNEVRWCKEKLVWMAMNSLGVRQVTKGGANAKRHLRHDDHHGSWLGFKEEDVDFLRWVSAGSKSSLEAFKFPGESWVLSLFQPDGTNPEFPVSYHGEYQSYFYDDFEAKYGVKD